MSDIEAIASAILDEWRMPATTIDEIKRNAAHVEAEFRRRTRALTAEEREQVYAIVFRRASEGPELIRAAERTLIERHRLADLLHEVRTCMHRLAPMVRVERAGPDGRARRLLDFEDDRDADAIQALENFCQRHGVSQILDEKRARERAEHFERLDRINANGPAALDRWLDARAAEDDAHHAHAAAPHKTAIDAQLRIARRYADLDVAAIRGETVEAVRQRRKIAKTRASETPEHAKARKAAAAASKARARKIRAPRRKRTA